MQKVRNLFILFILGVFAAIGMGTLYFIFAHILSDYYNTRSWIPVACIIEKANVLGHTYNNKQGGATTTTYKIEVQYRYQFLGKWYQGDRYQYFDLYSPGMKDKEKYISKHPPGTMISCYIDPHHPEKSVIERGLKLYYLVVLSLNAIVFLTIGLGGICSVLKEKEDSKFVPGTMTLRQISPSQKFLDAIGVGAFFYVLVIILGVIAWLPLYIKLGSWFFYESVYASGPYAIIGAVFFLYILYLMLSLFNPDTTITINSTEIRPGKYYTLNYFIKGNVNRLLTFSISLVGKSIMITGSGENSAIEETVFYEGKIYHQDHGKIMPWSIVEFKLPSELKPSSKQGNVEIKWAINVKGKIRFWPDINNEYPLHIYPK